MKIAVWGDELASWVAVAQLAAYGNDVRVLQAVDVAGTTEIRPSQSSVRAEPGLMEMIQAAVAKGQLRALSADQCEDVVVHWLAMAPDEEDKAVALVQRLAQRTEGSLLVINQSNFGIGASDRLQALLNSDAGQAVICLPDTLQQGRALSQFAQPKTLLVGCEDASALQSLQAILRPFAGAVQNLQLMSRREAEFTKFAITGMLALRLGYINELANLADLLAVDIDVVRQGMGSDERIGRHYLAPGCGFGGQHFTQYIEGLAGLFSEKRRSTLLDTVLTENQRQMELPFRKLWQHYECDLSGKTVALWGVAFKPGVASIDNAPALRIIDALLAQGARVRLHDPEALPEVREHYGDDARLQYCADKYDAAQGAEALLLLTEWPEYWSPDFERLAQSLGAKVIVDGRNVYDPALLRAQGFTYYGIGRL
ncbi:UDP binding domain-containing protein [Marinobacterium sedimentorum]|uniref:UDP binding domain-containing protein n=1 Tax=Marinobacterium sedimentorum TaxID=2927804 RepID=UPI0020C7208B|nr:UDP binding domain-containing protein [Marinobacterium sedimentorum]MCP8690312.1 UDP-glucose/GDP-mannose dehydrogenase family protein [Marinobacterium sedimentorum]